MKTRGATSSQTTLKSTMLCSVFGRLQDPQRNKKHTPRGTSDVTREEGKVLTRTKETSDGPRMGKEMRNRSSKDDKRETPRPQMMMMKMMSSRMKMSNNPQMTKDKKENTQEESACGEVHGETSN
ncbi:uncharacterized protein [Trachinotus anak]|uniref:uncharacterized protein isoform X2 n=1 Tax=Trachinotus anak TaxID=443729 RepID=UPI0039F24C0E